MAAGLNGFDLIGDSAIDSVGDLGTARLLKGLIRGCSSLAVPCTDAVFDGLFTMPLKIADVLEPPLEGAKALFSLGVLMARSGFTCSVSWVSSSSAFRFPFDEVEGWAGVAAAEGKKVFLAGLLPMLLEV